MFAVGLLSDPFENDSQPSIAYVGYRRSGTANCSMPPDAPMSGTEAFAPLAGWAFLRCLSSFGLDSHHRALWLVPRYFLESRLVVHRFRANPHKSIIRASWLVDRVTFDELCTIFLHVNFCYCNVIARNVMTKQSQISLGVIARNVMTKQSQISLVVIARNVIT